MRHLLLIPLLFCAALAFGQALKPINTIGTNGGSNPCFTGSTCVMHPSPTIGDALVWFGWTSGSGGATAASGCATWTHATVAEGTDTTSGMAQDVWYGIASATGPCTATFTIAGANTPKGAILTDVPAGSGASFAYDTASVQVSGSTLTPTGVSLTLATADEFIIQGSFYDNTVATCQNPVIDTYYFYGACQTEVEAARRVRWQFKRTGPTDQPRS